jgi:hypothetical protein
MRIEFEHNFVYKHKVVSYNNRGCFYDIVNGYSERETQLSETLSGNLEK